MKKKNQISFEDTLVLYRSTEDGCWIAHSLKTDQIGTGDRIVDALADVIRAVHQVCKAAGKDKTLAYLRAAPAEIRAIADRAKPLPGEIYEIAHKMVHGEWPKYLSADVEPVDSASSFTAHVSNDVCC